MAGRKSKYDSHVKHRLEEIRTWRIEDGLTEKQIAQKLGMHHDTLRVHKNKYPELYDVLKESKQILLSEIKANAYQLAKGGYKQVIQEVEPVVKEIWEKNSYTGELVLVRKEVILGHKKYKELAPNLAAQKYLLGNMEPEKWQENKEYLDVSGFNASVELISDIIEAVKDDKE